MVIMANPELAAQVLGQLRARGVEVGIDDSGAGYTSLALLRVLPVTALRIDRSVVSRMLEQPCDRLIAEAVIDLGHRLGLRVITGGVATDRLLDELITLGCDSAQRFVISPAVAAEELEGLLAAQELAAATAPAGPAPRGAAPSGRPIGRRSASVVHRVEQVARMSPLRRTTVRRNPRCGELGRALETSAGCCSVGGSEQAVTPLRLVGDRARRPLQLRVAGWHVLRCSRCRDGGTPGGIEPGEKGAW